MPKVPYTKTALSYADQLQQLKNRGLIVENDTKALHLLENISYYRLSGYWYPMIAQPKSAHQFKPDSTFNKAFKLYCFDRELRKLVLRELEKIEVAIRAKMIYMLWFRHGAFWYSNNALFTDRNKLAVSIRKLREENRRSDEEFLKSFRRKYSDPLPPACMILEISSFGNLSSFYGNLKPGHDKTLPNPRVGQLPLLNNNRAYFLLSMIIYLLNVINPTHTFKNKLFRLLKAYPMVDLKAMGFPQGWESEPLWNWVKVVKDEIWYNRIMKQVGIRKNG